MKKFFSSLLALVMCVGLWVPAFAQDNGETMYAEDMVAITSAYATELSQIAQERNISMDILSRQTIASIVDSSSTVHYGQPRYAALVSEIAIACAKYEKMNSLRERGVGRGAGRIENYTSYVVTGPDYLSGKELERMDVAHSSTVTRGGAITISSGTSIKGGYRVDVTYTNTVAYTLSGPPVGTKLGNGLLATHNVAFAVVYGTLLHEEYDYVDNESGTRYHYSQNVIDSKTARTSQYTVPAAFSSSTIYIQHAVYPSTVRTFSSESAFASSLASNPKNFF